jgi:hypothetical protein
MEGSLFSQVRRLCGQDPRQPSTDGDRHEREALHGAPDVLSFLISGTNSYALSPMFHCPP